MKRKPIIFSRMQSRNPIAARKSFVISKTRPGKRYFANMALPSAPDGRSSHLCVLSVRPRAARSALLTHGSSPTPSCIRAINQGRYPPRCNMSDRSSKQVAFYQIKKYYFYSYMCSAVYLAAPRDRLISPPRHYYVPRKLRRNLFQLPTATAATNFHRKP